MIAPIPVSHPAELQRAGLLTFTPRCCGSTRGFSTKHYEDFFTNIDWQVPLWNSLKIAPVRR
jgi:putative spermidine/putrescine transport system permease protein